MLRQKEKTYKDILLAIKQIAVILYVFLTCDHQKFIQVKSPIRLTGGDILQLHNSGFKNRAE